LYNLTIFDSDKYIEKYDSKFYVKSVQVCVCEESKCTNLTNFELIYPGQQIHLKLKATPFTVALYVDETKQDDDIMPVCDPVHHSTLKSRSKPQVNLVYTNCTTLSYTIRSNSSNWCMLHLRMATSEATVYSYNITLKSCPLGLILHDGLCICDPTLLHAIDGLTCDVQTGMFVRPPNSWIAMDPRNHSDIAYINQCHYDYCSLSPIMVDIKNDSDVQCVSSRSGIACGKCRTGLSTIFGTSACKKCTNTGLFLIPVFAVAGLFLVFILFAFNITVTDGKLYGFILFINCLSMYSFIFPRHGITYIVVSLLNLDLGMEVCFYNGMTTYIATWLRFVFPAYLFLIVMGLAIASRYFTRIEKLTRRRIIPVSATLYLLVLNKLVLITAQVLFSYAEVYHLYSKTSELYWSMDTDVQLFSVKYTLLFTFCLMIFMFVLMPITIFLLFPGYCYKISFISKIFRPFIDVYQAPFKDDCRYFLGIEFLLRTIANHGLCCIDSKLIPALQVILILTYLMFTGYCQPFKSKLNYLIYSSNVLFLGILATLVLYSYPTPSLTTTYVVMFISIIYLSLIEFLGIVTVYIVRTFINSNYKAQHSCQNFWKKCCLKLFVSSNSLQSNHVVNIHPDESEYLLREELIGYDVRD